MAGGSEGCGLDRLAARIHAMISAMPTVGDLEVRRSRNFRGLSIRHKPVPLLETSILSTSADSPSGPLAGWLLAAHPLSPCGLRPRESTKGREGMKLPEKGSWLGP